MRPIRTTSLFFLLLAHPSLQAAMVQPEHTPPPKAEFVTKRPASAHGLAGLLDAEGRLSLPADFSGSIDPAGFAMRLDHDGAPRFLAKGVPADPDERWDDGFASNGCDGPVASIAVGPGGELYLGGDFHYCGGVAANRIVRFDAGSGIWSALGSGQGNGVDGTVNVVTVLGNELYVGGVFGQANVGVPILANNIARWNGIAWSGVGDGFGNGVNDGVFALAVQGTDLLVGGHFTEANVGASAIEANGIARWNGSGWSPVGNDGGNGVDGPVHALAVIGGDLYVGGVFLEANFEALDEGVPSVVANYIARWNGSVWSAVGSGGNGVAGAVSSLAVLDGELYVGGSFTEANVGAAIPANRVARWNGASWAALGSGVGNGVNNPVTSLAIVGDDLYVGGLFSQANVGAAITTYFIARWNGAAWSAVGSDAGQGVSGWVTALAAAGGDLYVGGVFTQADVGTSPITANRIARWTGTAWSAPPGGNGVDGPVTALAVLDGDVYVGGLFNSPGGIAAKGIARWDGSAWSALGSNGGNGVDGGVFALAVSGSDLYVGGSFTVVNLGASIPANHIARWNGSAWSALGDHGGNGVDAPVAALAVLGSDLYVGGSFVQANVGAAITANRIARWNGSAWMALGSDGGNGVNDDVNALAVLGGALYAGGDFTQANEGAPIAANRVARWSGSDWTALGIDGGNGVNDGVFALAALGDDLFVGGEFTQANVGASIPANYIARWNGSDWIIVGSGGGNGVDGAVWDLSVMENNLYVGGDFAEVNVGAGIPANRIVRWTGSTWATLGSGTDAAVGAIVLTDPNTLHAGGGFQLAGGKPSSYFGRYTVPEGVFADGFEDGTQ